MTRTRPRARGRKPASARRPSGFAPVEAIGRTLPGVEVTTAWGQPALKARGEMVACIASHSSAEPESLVVRMEIADRDLLIEEDPATYYMTPHYLGYPCVLVRLSRVHPDALRDLVTSAHRQVMKQERSTRR
jgi:hypothetical protein